MIINWGLLLFFIILLSFLLGIVYRKKSKSEQQKWYWQYLERFCYFSGLKIIFRKFIPEKNNSRLPVGFIWLLGLYFAAYAFTSQRYESRLDKIEYQYNIFSTQVAAGATFENDRIMTILNSEVPFKPDIFNPISLFKSFKGYSEKFFESYGYQSAELFQRVIISEWATKLEGANFKKSNLNHMLFDHFNLNNAWFGESKLKETSFANAKLKNANFVDANLGGAIFEYANLEGAVFGGANLQKADLSGINALGADFEGTNLEGATFEQASLQGAIFFQIKIKNADFELAKLKGADFSLAILEKPYFYRANLENVYFEEATLENPIFYRANLGRAVFRRAEIKGADFRRTVLAETDFSWADIEGADFDEARSLTAKQLIRASNIIGIRNVSRKILADIKKWGCDEMLYKRNEDWTEELHEHRLNLIEKWDAEENGNVSTPGDEEQAAKHFIDSINVKTLKN